MGIAEEIRHALSRLDAEGIPHMLVGAFALSALGVPRASIDVDLQVGMDAAPSGSTFLGWIVEEHAWDPVFDQDVVIVHRPTSAVPFELFLTSHWFTKQALARRHHAFSALVGREVPIPRVEDFILLKAAHMVAPSRTRAKAAQDGVDIEGVIDAHEAALDLVYLEENGRRLGVWDAVAGLLDERRGA